VVDTSNLGGKVGDLLIQYRDPSTKNYQLFTHVIETKSRPNAKYTKSQERNKLELVRIDNRADVFELLGQNDWELV
jgi:hypothetical protein